MAGKIFYRERVKGKDGTKSPRYRVVAIQGVDLKVFADHLRRSELEQLATDSGASLVALARGEKHRQAGTTK